MKKHTKKINWNKVEKIMIILVNIITIGILIYKFKIEGLSWFFTTLR